jgi:hypothetical protein
MKIIGLDQKEYAWNITKYNESHENCSIPHSRARILLHNLFPYDQIYEEVVIPGIKTEINNRPLLLDFYIHFHRIAIEVQGEQHHKHIQFFHHNKLEYFRSRKLDSLKRQWCRINGITLVELPYNMSDQDWEHTIKNR